LNAAIPFDLSNDNLDRGLDLNSDLNNKQRNSPVLLFGTLDSRNKDDPRAIELDNILNQKIIEFEEYWEENMYSYHSYSFLTIF
jgi:hypothetical protein